MRVIGVREFENPGIYEPGVGEIGRLTEPWRELFEKLSTNKKRHRPGAALRSGYRYYHWVFASKFSLFARSSAVVVTVWAMGFQVTVLKREETAIGM